MCDRAVRTPSRTPSGTPGPVLIAEGPLGAPFADPGPLRASSESASVQAPPGPPAVTWAWTGYGLVWPHHVRHHRTHIADCASLSSEQPQPGAVLCCFRRSGLRGSMPLTLRSPVPRTWGRPARLVEPPIGLVWVVIHPTLGPRVRSPDPAAPANLKQRILPGPCGGSSPRLFR